MRRSVCAATVLVQLACHPSGIAAQVWRAESSEATLTPFAQAKADWLIRNRYPCLGCHELDGEGGRIGPSLTDVTSRRTAQYVLAMIRDPRRTAPGSLMPRTPMPDATAALLARYLTTRTGPPVASGQDGHTRGGAPGAEARSNATRAGPTTATSPARPADPTAVARAAPPGPASGTEAAELYARHCAACHGPTGDGDGFNARFLVATPTAHSDSLYMSTRSDDALFDAIAGGGYFMNRSSRMPAFRELLDRGSIRALVRHLRRLCRCEGPSWSRAADRDAALSVSPAGR
jgi:mono/diheme cytochrome c family protein